MKILVRVYRNVWKLPLEVISVGTLRSVVRGSLGFANKQYSGIMALRTLCAWCVVCSVVYVLGFMHLGC